MGDKELDQGGDGIAPSTYSVTAYPGADLPEEYMSMIFSNWKVSLKYGNGFFFPMERSAFDKMYNLFISSILARPNAVVRIAALTDDSDNALGWSLIDRDILHYVYVKNAYRGLGITKFLIPNKIRTITHIMNFMLMIRYGPQTGQVQLKLKPQFEKYIFDPSA